MSRSSDVVSNLSGVFEPPVPKIDHFAAVVLKAKLDQEFGPALVASARALLLFLKRGVRLKQLLDEFHGYGLQGAFPAMFLCEPKKLAEVAKAVVEAGFIDQGDELLQGIDLTS